MPEAQTNKKQTIQNPKKKAVTSTQEYLSIAEIRDDTIILKDGSLRAILLVSSINFGLKSEEEQNAIVQGYMSFLNSLDFSLQIVIQSRKLNINSFLQELEKLEHEQTNELLKMQTKEYRGYVKELVELGEIMQKKFYIIVPYSTAEDPKKGFMKRLIDVLSPTQVIKLREKEFNKYKQELEKRVDKISSELAGMSLNAILLDTQSLIELFYNTYNPEMFNQQKLIDIEKLRVGE